MKTLRVRIVFFVAKLMGVPVKVRDTFYGMAIGCYEANQSKQG